MKKTYSSPQMQVIEVKQADIIATSSTSIESIYILEGENPWDNTNPGF